MDDQIIVTKLYQNIHMQLREWKTRNSNKQPFKNVNLK